MKERQNHTMEKRNGAGLIGYLYLEEMQIDPYLPLCTKLKWIKGLNIKPGTLNPVENKVENSLDCIGTGDNFS